MFKRKRVNVDIQSIKSTICNQNRVLKALISSVHDASAIWAALSHVNGDLFNVHVYIFHVQNKKQRTELTENILLSRQKTRLNRTRKNISY